VRAQVRLQRRVRVAALGRDRLFRRFWAFPSIGGLLVEAASHSAWHFVATDEALKHIVAALDPRGIREKQLLHQLAAVRGLGEPAEWQRTLPAMAEWAAARRDRLHAAGPPRMVDAVAAALASGDDDVADDTDRQLAAAKPTQAEQLAMQVRPAPAVCLAGF
jgi:hypothetical protein